eukprot:tig00000241_g20892.t1
MLADFLIEFEHFVLVVEADERGHGRTNYYAQIYLDTALRYRRSAEDAWMLKIYEQILEEANKIHRRDSQEDPQEARDPEEAEARIRDLMREMCHGRSLTPSAAVYGRSVLLLRH